MLQKMIAGPVSLLVGVISIWSLLAQGAKRCHDMNRSGWWQLLFLSFIVAPIFFKLTSQSFTFMIAYMVLGIASILIPVIFILWLSLRKGMIGENKYGPDPKQ